MINWTQEKNICFSFFIISVNIKKKISTLAYLIHRLMSKKIIQNRSIFILSLYIINIHFKLYLRLFFNFFLVKAINF